MLLDSIMAGAIKLADRINAIHDPFDEFTRPIIRRTAESLASKAGRFEAQMKSDFRLANDVYTYKKPRPGEALDLGDQALWHGIYTAMWAMKYSVTQSAADESTLRYAVRAATGAHIKEGKLIRGTDPVQGGFADDASNDTLTGFVTGQWAAYRCGTPAIAQEAGANLIMVAEEILANGHALVNQDGTPTTYGQLVQGWKTDPLRLTLAIAIYSAAYEMSRMPKWDNAAAELTARYWQIIGFPKVKFLWWEKQYDTHRAALHLGMILKTTQNQDLRKQCISGLARIWQMEHKAQDPWVAGLCHDGGVDPVALKAAAQRLHEYEFDERGQEVERINTNKQDYWKSQGVRFLVWDDNWRASQPLPFWMIGSQDFFPQRDLFSADNWQGETDPGLRYNGGDFLASYWLHRINGTIGPNE